MLNEMTKEKFNPADQTQELNENIRELILFNDDINTFDFVIETLIDVCGHEPNQAEQCALVAHYNGKCAVKSGSQLELKPYYTEMTNRKLSVIID
jgi:ATP-dependent Clp protease adaptor protein ClpS